MPVNYVLSTCAIRHRTPVYEGKTFPIIYTEDIIINPNAGCSIRSLSIHFILIMKRICLYICLHESAIETAWCRIYVEYFDEIEFDQYRS